MNFENDRTYARNLSESIEEEQIPTEAERFESEEVPESELCSIKEELPLLGSEGGLAMFFHDMRKYPLLTTEEERALGERAFNGDKLAQDKLVLHNLRLAVSIAGTTKAVVLKLRTLCSMEQLVLIRLQVNSTLLVGSASQRMQRGGCVKVSRVPLLIVAAQ